MTEAEAVALLRGEIDRIEILLRDMLEWESDYPRAKQAATALTLVLDALESRAQPKDETAWLLERDDNGPVYIGVDGGLFEWVRDPNKALRLARRADGDALAEILDDASRIVEHMWPAPPPTPETGTEGVL